jgi:hypothetical protein
MKASAWHALALVLVMTPGSAHATDTKSFHGAACVGSTVDDLVALEFGVDGVVNVAQSATAIVVCPLIRDHINSSSQIDSVAIEAYNASGSFSCYLWTQAEDIGGGVLSWDYKTTSSTGNVQLSNFTVETTPGNEGSYSVTCDLGPSDRLYHIYLSETGTD